MLGTGIFHIRYANSQVSSLIKVRNAASPSPQRQLRPPAGGRRSFSGGCRQAMRGYFSSAAFFAGFAKKGSDSAPVGQASTQSRQRVHSLISASESSG